MNSVDTSSVEDDLVENFQQKMVLRRFKRPLLTLNKRVNDVYLTRDVPLCVYYRRCVKLLRWHLPLISKVFSSEFMQNNNNNFSVTELLSKNKVLVSFSYLLILKVPTDANGQMYYPDGQTSLQKHLEDPMLRIFGSGFCVKKSFYLLQDLYYHIVTMYKLSFTRFLHKSGVLKYCDDCKNKVNTGLKLSDNQLSKLFECESCMSLNKAMFEDLFKSVFEVFISTDSICCSDDLWILDSSSNDPKLSVEPANRYISSVSITLKPCDFNL
uniref:Uncharacterized protein n=1 Tax=Theileria annulata TaxID=5874 RepID=A0A3B0MZF5_THEAN